MLFTDASQNERSRKSLGEGLSSSSDAFLSPPDFGSDAIAMKASGEDRRYKLLFVIEDPAHAESVQKEFEERGYSVVFARGASDGVALLLKTEPDLVLAEVGTSEIPGLEVFWNLDKLAPKFANVPFLFLIGSGGRTAGRQCRAQDFIVWPTDLAQLEEEVAVRLKSARVLAVPHPLTERELEALQWIASGKHQAETARLMDITPRTVMFHLTRARKKLGVSSLIEAVTKAAVLRLIKTKWA